MASVTSAAPFGQDITRLNQETSRKRGWLVVAALGLIIALAAFLRFYELGAYGVGNTYYAATVKSMLTSWKNFFFASFEPGGSVTVDKPPLGLWVQAVSANFLGVNGFALALPQALAMRRRLPSTTPPQRPACWIHNPGPAVRPGWSSAAQR